MGLLDNLRGVARISVGGGARNLTEENPDFWRDLEPGTIVDLSDYQAMRDASKLGNETLHVDYTITSMKYVQPPEGLVEYYLYDIEGAGENLLLTVKIVGDVFDIFIYFPISGVEPGNRLSFEQQGFDWLFIPVNGIPEMLPDFPRNEWLYTQEFFIPIDDKLNNKIDGKFNLKAPGELTGPCRQNPPVSGLDTMIATVAEYCTEADTMNPEVLLLEVGNPDNEDGGLIKAYIGVAVDLRNVEAFRTQ